MSDMAGKATRVVVERSGSCRDTRLSSVARKSNLLRLLALFLRERQAIRLFPARLAFLHIISAVAVSHNVQPSRFGVPVPSRLFPFGVSRFDAQLHLARHAVV
jgi:hypothetical protein